MGREIMNKEKIVNQILNNLPSYNKDDVLNVKLIKGKPITVEHYARILEPISRRRYSYIWHNMGSSTYETQTYTNYYANNNVKSVLRNVKNISISRLNECLDKLLNFKSEIVHYEEKV